MAAGRVRLSARRLSRAMTLAVPVGALLVAHAVAAAPFQNGSFESGSVSNTCNVYNLGVGDMTITGWIVSVGNIDWEGPPPCGWKASDGNNSIDLVGNAAVGGIEQSFDTVAGRTYRVTFDLAGNYGGLPVVKPLTVTVAGQMHDFTFDTTGASGSNMNWTTKTFTFVAESSSSTISFVSDTTGLGGIGNAGAAIDNVRITLENPSAAAPALTGMPLCFLALLLCGGGSLLIRRRAEC